MGKGRTFIVGVVVGALVAGGTVAIAAIPDSGTGVITSCLKKKEGTLRVIDAQAGKRCTAGETLLTWNQQGPTGATGPAGPAGIDGVNAHTYGTSAATRTEVATATQWQPLTDATVTIPTATASQRAIVTFWSSAACFGAGSKYARLVINGVPGPSSPIAPIPNTGFSESQNSITGVIEVPANTTGSVTVDVMTDIATSCVWTPGQWSLNAVVSLT